MPEPFALTTADPKFDPRQPVTVNGYAYVRAPETSYDEIVSAAANIIQRSMDNHQRFTVDRTAYLRNLDREDLRAPCIAVHYQKRPKRNPESNTTSYSLRFPMLIVAHYLETPEPVAEKVAAILNEHWPEDGNDG